MSRINIGAVIMFNIEQIDAFVIEAEKFIVINP